MRNWLINYFAVQVQVSKLRFNLQIKCHNNVPASIFVVRQGLYSGEVLHTRSYIHTRIYIYIFSENNFMVSWFMNVSTLPRYQQKLLLTPRGRLVNTRICIGKRALISANTHTHSLTYSYKRTTKDKLWVQGIQTLYIVQQNFKNILSCYAFNWL